MTIFAAARKLEHKINKLVFIQSLSLTATIPTRMQQLDPVGIDYTQQRWGCQKAIGPRLVGPEQAKQARALGQLWKQGVVIAD